jgi:hypothetical protein
LSAKDLPGIPFLTLEVAMSSTNDFMFLSKVLNAKRDGKTMADRPKSLRKGKHRLKGTVKYDITADVGEDSEALRAYGVPADDILDLAGHLCGALRPYLVKAAAVATELTRARLEDRPVKGAVYTVDGELQRVPREEVRKLAKSLAEKPDIRQGLSKSVKIKRPYAGQVKIVEAEVEIS